MLRARTRSLLILALLLSLLFSGGCRRRAPEALRVPSSDLLPRQLPADDASSVSSSQRAVPVELEGPAAPSLIISAGLHGYTEPCGCTEDILQGGIDRLAGVAGALAELLPGTLVISAGDTLFRFPQATEAEAAQDVARLEALAVSLKAAGMKIMGVGPRDLSRGIESLEAFAEASGAQLVSTNLQPRGDARWHPVVVQVLRGRSVVFMSIVDPDAFKDIDDTESLELLDARAQLQQHISGDVARHADARVLFFHGPEEAAAKLINAVEGVDFLILSQASASTNEAATWGTTTVLKVWTQGRELGVLRLEDSSQGLKEQTWSNARALSSDESEGLQELITAVDEQIQGLKARLEPEQESQLLERMRERKAGYEQELLAADSDEAPSFTPGHRQFLWDILPLVPGLPENSVAAAARQSYNRQLQAINLEGATPPPPAAEGEPSFVGDASCASCHSSAHTQWKSTAHGSAFATLVEREKHFDLECVGCHVTGYKEPGGSSLGFFDNLENVQCESCHGPGSLHAAAPTADASISASPPQFITRETTEATCLSCHTAEHSPRFDYESYLPRILGEGHGR